MSFNRPDAARGSDAWFATTHWSVVLSAQGKGAPRSAEALETLCRTYWYPLYAFARRQGHSPHEAEDLVQEFFARLLAKDYLAAVEREKGRFRTFLIMTMKRFMANEWERGRTLKRGGGQAPVSLDTTLAESRFLADTSPSLSADVAYDRQWAVTLLERTMTRLREAQAAHGEEKTFAVLGRFLTVGGEAPSMGEAAAQLGISDAAARMAVHRLRHRFRELFREEIAQTLACPEDLEEEIRYLVEVLSQ